MFKANVQYKITNYSSKPYHVRSLVSGDKLVKVQTPPLFFHQFTLLSYFTLVIAGNTADQ